jgi:hypothetical protein
VSPEGAAPANFDLEAAWLRRFQSDVLANLRAFALTLQEAMPELVTIEERRGLFERKGTVIGVSVVLGDHRYDLKCDKGRLQAHVAMVVRGITLNTKSVEPGEWFRQLSEETHKASEHARSLSQSISSFMGQ